MPLSGGQCCVCGGAVEQEGWERKPERSARLEHERLCVCVRSVNLVLRASEGFLSRGGTILDQLNTIKIVLVRGSKDLT